MEQSSVNNCGIESRVRLQTKGINKCPSSKRRDSRSSNRKNVASSGFLSVHHRKKTSESNSNTDYDNTHSLIGLEKVSVLSGKRDIFHLKDRSKSTEKLVPLLKKESEPVSEQTIDDHFRDRLLKEVSNKRMSFKLKHLNQISGSSIHASKVNEEYTFDYNGSKIGLAKAISMKSYNNILKTVYRVNN